LAAAYLDEIKKEFDIQYGPEVRGAERPYAFIKFGTQQAKIFIPSHLF